MARIIKERTTRLEGSYRKEKEHYNLKKIKATEILCVFFGIHTANCLEIGRWMQKITAKHSLVKKSKIYAISYLLWLNYLVLWGLISKKNKHLNK